MVDLRTVLIRILCHIHSYPIIRCYLFSALCVCVHMFVLTVLGLDKAFNLTFYRWGMREIIDKNGPPKK